MLMCLLWYTVPSAIMVVADYFAWLSKQNISGGRKGGNIARARTDTRSGVAKLAVRSLQRILPYLVGVSFPFKFGKFIKYLIRHVKYLILWLLPSVWRARFSNLSHLVNQ